MFNFDETAEASQATISSTDSSTERQQPVQPVEAVAPAQSFSRSGWKMEELKKVRKTAQKIVSNYCAFRSPRRRSSDRQLAAAEFFRAEWPSRSPYAVYQKALKIKHVRKIFLV